MGGQRELLIEFCKDTAVHPVHRWGRWQKCPGITRESVPQHNHVTRDIKPPGECPSCDLYWDGFGS